MKIRIKFAKLGYMKFIGHLDIMRYFQKALNRAHIDVVYTEGFSPHQKMSFAAPLGVGNMSVGEYMDIEVHSTASSTESIQLLNAAMVEGMQIIDYRLLPEDSGNAMSIVAAADYFVSYKEDLPIYKLYCDSLTKIDEFINRTSIDILKKSKRAEKVTDIRPYIYEFRYHEYEGIKGIYMKLATGSVNNLTPYLVMDAYTKYLLSNEDDFDESSIDVTRMEIYAESTDSQGKYVSLIDLGDVIE